MARHELALCTPATAEMYRHRLGPRPVKPMQFREPIEIGSTRLTALPSGHVFGSAMLLAEEEGRSLLYTGDFRLDESATAEAVELPRADYLVMETTYGDPRYRLPPREQVVAELIDLVSRVLAEGATPVVYAYVLGKAQEVTRLLTDAGIPVLQHRAIHQISRIYERCGCPLGNFDLYPGHPVHGHAVIAPPRRQKIAPLENITRKVAIGVTGWGIDPRARYRLGVDHVLPLSDHADFDQLIEAVERVDPKVVYCTHGPTKFVDRLRERGFDARRVEDGMGPDPS